jgi:hypothetical protein
MQRERDGILIGAGAGLTLIVLLVLQSFIGSGLFSTRTVTVTVTNSDAYEQVSDAYANHLMAFNARNINALPDEYESNATVEWIGVNPGLNGNYSGAGDIKILWGSFIGKLANFSLSNEYQSLGEVNGSNAWMVNSTFNFDGYDAVLGNVNGTVVAQDLYAHVDGAWLIAKEIWNFTRFNMPPLG